MNSIAVVSLVVTMLAFVACEELEYPKVEIKNSWPCKHRTVVSDQESALNRSKIPNNWNENIKIVPKDVTFKLIGPSKPGCYKFKVKVQVKAHKVQDLWLRVLILLGDLKSEPLQCTKTDADNADPNSCEKGWGSCIWCNGCNKVTTILKDKNQDKKATCPLLPSTYNMEQEFCFPKIAEFGNTVPETVKKVLELKTKEGEDARVVTKDIFIVAQMYEHNIYAACSSLKPDQCPESETQKMTGCIVSSARVTMKTIKELTLVAAPTRQTHT